MAKCGVEPLAQAAGRAVSIGVRLSSDLIAELKAAAKEKGWSRSEEIEDRLGATLAEDRLASGKHASDDSQLSPRSKPSPKT